jgi:NhaA family Na+:H+ antiporter
LPQRPRLANRIANILVWLAGGEAASGLLLMGAAGVALIMANSPLAADWHDLFHHPLSFSPVAKLDSWHLWINDGAMALFFFAVGLEIKREVLDGDLASAARRRLPVIAAIAGMALPALVYLIVGGSAPHLRAGWAVPAATDIAFALGVLALVGNRVPPSLRLLLLTIAIVDDIGAVAIIALFYTTSIKLVWLAAAVGCLAAMAALGRWRIGNGWVYAALSIGAWYCTLHSGIHATVAGVAAALFIPLRLDRGGDSLLLRMEHALAPWIAYFVLPLFGLANAGAQLHGGIGELLQPLPLAVAAGLVLGKQIGIFGAIWACCRMGLTAKPAGASWAQIWGLALLCGIGFTMSLFIAALAFPASPELVEEAKLGVLAGSLLSALGGFAVLRLSGRTR